MGKALERLLRVLETRERKRKPAALSDEDRLARRAAYREAAEQLALLDADFTRGAPHSFALSVLRKDGYRCSRCGASGSLFVRVPTEEPTPLETWVLGAAPSAFLDAASTLCSQCATMGGTNDAST